MLLEMFVEYNLITLIIIIGTVIFMRKKSVRYKEVTLCIFINLLLTVILSIVDTLELWTKTFKEPTNWRILLSAIGYTLRPVVIMMFVVTLIKDKKKRILLSIPSIINMIIAFSAFFTDIAYSYNETNEFVRGPLGFASHIACFLYLGIFAFITFTNKENDKDKKIFLLMIIISVGIVILCNTLFGLSGKLNAIIAVVNVFYYMHYYINISVDETFDFKDANENKKTLERIAYIDELTGLGNRTLFSGDLVKLDNEENVIFVSMDINNLKICNDLYGHAEGDKFIIDAAKCIAEAFDSFGKCYRIGGDEFAVLVTNKKEKEFKRRLEKLNTIIDLKNAERIMPITIAVGYAFKENKSENMESVYNRSDAMMYNDKRRMKKEFAVYSEKLIKQYLEALEILGKSTDDYLFLWDIKKDENWFYGDVDHGYEIRKPGQLVNKTEDMIKIVFPADRKALSEDLGQIATGEKDVHNMNYRWINRDGNPVWISCRGRLIRDPEGKPFVMLGRVSDTALMHLYNPNTSLFNLNKLLQDLTKYLKTEKCEYLLSFEIDNLSDIILEKGIKYGEKMLCELAHKLEHVDGVLRAYHLATNRFGIVLDTDNEEFVSNTFNYLINNVFGDFLVSAGATKISVEYNMDEFEIYYSALNGINKSLAEGHNIVTFYKH